MSKIKLTDTIIDIVLKMSKDNPGAIQTLMEILTGSQRIDPECLFQGLGPLLMLDTYEIYGSDIYILFNDKCNGDVRILLMLLRAVQLGYYPEAKLKQLAADQSRQVNITTEELNELDIKVCEFLKDFQKPFVKV